MATRAVGERPVELVGSRVGELVAMGSVADGSLVVPLVPLVAYVEGVLADGAVVDVVVALARANMARSVCCHRIGIPSQMAVVWAVMGQVVWFLIEGMSSGMFSVGVGVGIHTDVRVWPTVRAVVQMWLLAVVPVKQLQFLSKLADCVYLEQ